MSQISEQVQLGYKQTSESIALDVGKLVLTNLDDLLGLADPESLGNI